MNKRRLAYRALLAATLGVYAAMILWTLPAIIDSAGGLMPFDLRPGGYTLGEAEAFLANLEPRGRVLYLGWQHRLDLAYPALLACLLAWSIAIQARAIGGRLVTGLCWFGGIAAVAGMIFDYLENGAVAGLLGAAEPLDPVLVAQASTWTVGKSAATSVAIIVLALLLVWRGVRYWVRRQ